MNGRTDSERIDDMIQYAREAIVTLGNADFTEFCADRQLHLAIFYLLAVVGEAASKSDAAALRQQFPTIPWREVRGARNRLVHGYYHIRMDLVYEIVVEHLPVLIAALQPAAHNHPGGQPS